MSTLRDLKKNHDIKIKSSEQRFTQFLSSLKILESELQWKELYEFSFVGVIRYLATL